MITYSISILENEDGHAHVYCTTDGDTAAEALRGAQYVLDTLCRKGKVSYIRAKPEVNSETDFDTKQVRHRGFVRFITTNMDGEWKFLREPTNIPLVGSAQ